MSLHVDVQSSDGFSLRTPAKRVKKVCFPKMFQISSGVTGFCQLRSRHVLRLSCEQDCPPDVWVICHEEPCARHASNKNACL